MMLEQEWEPKRVHLELTFKEADALFALLEAETEMNEAMLEPGPQTVPEERRGYVVARMRKRVALYRAVLGKIHSHPNFAARLAWQRQMRQAERIANGRPE